MEKCGFDESNPYINQAPTRKISDMEKSLLPLFVPFIRPFYLNQVSAEKRGLPPIFGPPLSDLYS
jgi:hypothetical protein